MGMFDSTYDADGHEWQTKAYGCNLTRWHIGDLIDWDHPFDAYQVEVFGGDETHRNGQDGWATIRDGILVAVPAQRDEDLPLVDYCGGCASVPAGEETTA